ncbi:MAG: hypothetical protein ACJ75F_01950 [Flavisolibacter sp.]
MIRSVNTLLFLLSSALLISCQKEASFETNQPTGPGSGGTAVFTLSGSGSTCSNANISGTYSLATALTSSNQVSIEVNVATPGSWTVNTGAVAGFYFSGAGTFTTAGVQTITLNGSGTPTSSGDQTFTLLVGSGTCSFIVSVESTPNPNPPPTGDHFILTGNSWWSYEDPTAPGDTIKRTIVGTVTIAANPYKVFENDDGTGNKDSSFYRKSGNDYLEYTYADYYSLMTFDNNVVGDILFLKEGAATGATWNSQEFSGSLNSQTVKLRYAFTMTNASATVTVNGKTFTHVNQVTFKSQISTLGSPYVDEGLTWNMYYAQGIGLIYTKISQGGQFNEINIRYYKIF